MPYKPKTYQPERLARFIHVLLNVMLPPKTKSSNKALSEFWQVKPSAITHDVRFAYAICEYLKTKHPVLSETIFHATTIFMALSEGKGIKITIN